MAQVPVIIEVDFAVVLLSLVVLVPINRNNNFFEDMMVIHDVSIKDNEKI